MGGARRWRYGVYLLLALVLRALLYRDYPLLLTADSWDYLGATTAIAQRLDFASITGNGLRDCRVPGYPVFQAVFFPLTQLQSDRILLLQAALGLLGILLGWAIGRVLRAPAVAEGLVL